MSQVFFINCNIESGDMKKSLDLNLMQSPNLVELQVGQQRNNYGLLFGVRYDESTNELYDANGKQITSALYQKRLNAYATRFGVQSVCRVVLPRMIKQSMRMPEKFLGPSGWQFVAFDKGIPEHCKEEIFGAGRGRGALEWNTYDGMLQYFTPNGEYTNAYMLFQVDTTNSPGCDAKALSIDDRDPYTMVHWSFKVSLDSFSEKMFTLDKKEKGGIHKCWDFIQNGVAQALVVGDFVNNTIEGNGYIMDYVEYEHEWHVSFYEGEIKKRKRSGKGKQLLLVNSPDQPLTITLQEGEWVAGHYHGAFKFVRNDETVSFVDYEHGVIVGCVRSISLQNHSAELYEQIDDREYLLKSDPTGMMFLISAELQEPVNFIRELMRDHLFGFVRQLPKIIYFSTLYAYCETLLLEAESSNIELPYLLFTEEESNDLNYRRLPFVLNINESMISGLLKLCAADLAQHSSSWLFEATSAMEAIMNRTCTKEMIESSFCSLFPGVRYQQSKAKHGSVNTGIIRYCDEVKQKYLEMIIQRLDVIYTLVRSCRPEIASKFDELKNQAERILEEKMRVTLRSRVDTRFDQYKFYYSELHNLCRSMVREQEGIERRLLLIKFQLFQQLSKAFCVHLAEAIREKEIRYGQARNFLIERQKNWQKEGEILQKKDLLIQNESDSRHRLEKNEDDVRAIMVNEYSIFSKNKEHLRPFVHSVLTRLPQSIKTRFVNLTPEFERELLVVYQGKVINTLERMLQPIYNSERAIIKRADNLIRFYTEGIHSKFSACDFFCFDSEAKHYAKAFKFYSSGGRINGALLESILIEPNLFNTIIRLANLEVKRHHLSNVTTLSRPTPRGSSAGSRGVSGSLPWTSKSRNVGLGTRAEQSLLNIDSLYSYVYQLIIERCKQTALPFLVVPDALNAASFSQIKQLILCAHPKGSEWLVDLDVLAQECLEQLFQASATESLFVTNKII